MIKVALLTDDFSVKKWQINALDYAGDLIDIDTVLSCKNTSLPKNLISHCLYYFINIFTLRGNLTKNIIYDTNQKNVIEFDSIYEKNWQKIPDDIIEKLQIRGINIIIKFGMGLLKISGPLAQMTVLSYHHGDPSEFRGRPAGFYEILREKASVGTIVQSINNKLDSGTVWAISHSKIFHHSYKSTSTRLYSNSKYLLRKAITNIQNSNPVNIESNGLNFKLPSNYLVIKFILILFLRKLRRIFYAMFFEKKWKIVFSRKFRLDKKRVLFVKDCYTPPITPPYTFYADPFFSVDGEKIYVEAMKSNGRGDILEINRKNFAQNIKIFSGGHFSYPFVFEQEHYQFLMPEVASHSAPFFVRTDDEKGFRQYLKGFEFQRIVDATLFKFKDIYYLFFGLEETASDCLYIYYSTSLDAEFLPHELNPVVIDPSRARMAGSIISYNGKVYRLGQNNSYGYGNGITVAEILALSSTDYREEIVSTLCYGDASGPHTLSIGESEIVLDYYTDEFSFFSGVRRALSCFTRTPTK
jgi:hypothetical protein